MLGYVRNRGIVDSKNTIFEMGGLWGGDIKGLQLIFFISFSCWQVKMMYETSLRSVILMNRLFKIFLVSQTNHVTELRNFF